MEKNQKAICSYVNFSSRVMGSCEDHQGRLAWLLLRSALSCHAHPSHRKPPLGSALLVSHISEHLHVPHTFNSNCLPVLSVLFPICLLISIFMSTVLVSGPSLIRTIAVVSQPVPLPLVSHLLQSVLYPSTRVAIQK